MAFATLIQIPGGTREQYESMVKEMQIEPNRFPAGLIHHAAGPLEDGWCMINIWESEADFDRFFKGPVQKAMQRVKQPAPQIKSFTVHNMMGQGALSHR